MTVPAGQLRAAIRPQSADFSPETPRTRAERVEVMLASTLVAIRNDEPCVLVRAVEADKTVTMGLAGGPFDASQYDTVESAARALITATTRLPSPRLDQLCTISGHGKANGAAAVPSLIVGFLGLLGNPEAITSSALTWQSWYTFLPWEDRRSIGSHPNLFETALLERAETADSQGQSRASPVTTVNRRRQVECLFGLNGHAWDETKVVERFDVLRAIGLISEHAINQPIPMVDQPSPPAPLPAAGTAMLPGHRHVLAAALSRLRARIKDNPVVPELLANEFTLFELQKVVEAILKPNLHKQNFRRQVESANLVEATGHQKRDTGGRPAELYHYSSDALLRTL
jgi:hypothetical protein